MQTAQLQDINNLMVKPNYLFSVSLFDIWSRQQFVFIENSSSMAYGSLSELFFSFSCWFPYFYSTFKFSNAHFSLKAYVHFHDSN